MLGYSSHRQPPNPKTKPLAHVQYHPPPSQVNKMKQSRVKQSIHPSIPPSQFSVLTFFSFFNHIHLSSLIIPQSPKSLLQRRSEQGRKHMHPKRQQPAERYLKCDESPQFSLPPNPIPLQQNRQRKLKTRNFCRNQQIFQRTPSPK